MRSPAEVSIVTDRPVLLFYSGDCLSHPVIRRSGVHLGTLFFPDFSTQASFLCTCGRQVSDERVLRV